MATLSQAKVDLAVLYWLWDLAEHDAQPPTPSELAEMFPPELFSIRRIEVALAELEGRGQVEGIPYPSEGVYRWQITRDGFGVVDRALKLPNTFIARTATDPNWLKSDEAAAAVLAKLPVAEPKPTNSPAVKPDDLAIHIHNNVNSSNNNALNAPAADPTEPNSSTRASWFSGWAAWTSALIGLATLVLALYQMKVI